MPAEIEAKFVVSNLEALRAQLPAVGAVLRQPRTLMRRRIFDFPALTLDAKAAWLRVRDEGHRTVLTYKQRENESLGGMVELETEVASFSTTCSILEAIGMIEKAYQENYREIWDMNNSEIALDEWPWIPFLVEIEASSEELVRQTAEKLGMDWSDAIFDSVDAIYQRHYEVSRTEVSSIPLIFRERHPLLAAKIRTVTY